MNLPRQHSSSQPELTLTASQLTSRRAQMVRALNVIVDHDLSERSTGDWLNTRKWVQELNNDNLCYIVVGITKFPPLSLKQRDEIFLTFLKWAL